MLNSIVKSLVFVSLIGLPLLSVATEMDTSSGTEVVGKRVPVKIEGKKVLPLRVLTRPFSNIYTEKSIESGIEQSQVPAMQPFYVYTRPSAEDLELESGWYEVGSDSQGKVIGWMQSKDVFEWKQTMCLVYTHPEGRKPVLMFDSKSTINKLIKMPEEERVKDVDAIYAAIDEHNISKNFVVKSVEPKRAVDIKKEFYLLPILDFEAVEIAGRPARIVKLAAVTNARAGAREKGDIRKNEKYKNNALAASTKVSKTILKKLPVDIVWVIDTTVSMRPYIQDTLDLIQTASTKMAENTQDNVTLNFGVWGYRDSVEDMPKIEYTTKNYTPELVGVKDFINVLSNVKVTPVDSVDYPEDMFSGISDAMEKTAWSSEGMKLVILVGDAPSHQSGHKWNLSKQNEETLRNSADDNSIYIAALHIDNPKAKRFHELATTQYQSLSTNPGSKDDYAFEEILSTDKEAFKESANKLANEFIKGINNIRQVIKAVPNVKSPIDKNLTSITSGELAFSDENNMVDINEVIPEVPMSDKSMTGMANRMFRAAMIEWIGSQTGAEAPKDIVAWVIDKDLMDPGVPSLDVKLLINKRQLDSLATAIEDIIRAGNKRQTSSENFFSLLQATAVTITRDPNKIKEAKRVADSGLIPEFLVGLPYESEVMALTDEYWSGKSIDEQNQFINSLESKVTRFRDIHDTPELWIELNKGDDIDEYVYPLSIDDLP